MYVRRLIILFALLSAAVGVLVLRLSYLQVVEHEKWSAEAQAFLRRHYIIDVTRAPILDCKNRPVAVDVPCYDLAIDYRALTRDQLWITKLARQRLIEAGYTTRSEWLKRLPAEKAHVEAQIDAMPAAIGQACNIPEEDVLERLNNIVARIRALKQDHWARQDSDALKNAGNADNSRGGGGGGDSLVETSDVKLKDEAALHVIVAAVPDPVWIYFKKHLSDFPGLAVSDSHRRIYPFNDVAAHVVGGYHVVSAEAIKEHPFVRPSAEDDADDTPGDRKGYLPGDYMGDGGIEQVAEDTLRGARGVRLLDRSGNEVLGARMEPEEGHPVKLTLDMEMQKNLQAALQDPARNLLKGKDGQNHNVAIVVLRLQDDAVLSMVSLPTYDLNFYVQNINTLRKDVVNLPLMNRAISAKYPPGSTVKALVATAALTEGVVTSTEVIHCNGHLYPNVTNAFRCWIYEDYGIGHGPVQLTTALEQSCNVFFYTMGQRLGLPRIVDWYQRFGFGDVTGIDLPAEADGDLPDLSSYDAVAHPQRSINEATYLGIGQGPISVTPLQLANAYATLLRGGLKMTPTVVQDWPRPPATPLSYAADALPVVKQGLYEVVNGRAGTGKIMQMRVSVAGKTGTATDTKTVMLPGPGGGPPVKTQMTGDDAWFVGYVPADEPQYVIAAVMEYGGHGGQAAAPMARETIMQMERAGYLPAVDTEASVAQHGGGNDAGD